MNLFLWSYLVGWMCSLSSDYPIYLDLDTGCKIVATCGICFLVSEIIGKPGKEKLRRTVVDKDL